VTGVDNLVTFIWLTATAHQAYAVRSCLGHRAYTKTAQGLQACIHYR